MEWNIYSEESIELVSDLELTEAVNDELQEDESLPSLTRPVSARRTIEILREQKELEQDTWDYFEH